MIEFVIAAALMSDVPVKPKAPVAPAPVAARAAADVPVLNSVSVTLECTARASGRIENCAVLGETHPGLGFGEAAIALMRGAETDPGPRDVQFARTIQFMP